MRLYTHTHIHTHILLHHLPGVGLLLGGQTDVLACVDCVIELKGVEETAAMKGNRAPCLILCAGSLRQPSVHRHVHVHT